MCDSNLSSSQSREITNKKRLSLVRYDEDIWYADGDDVCFTFLNIPYTTRMIVVKLPSSDLAKKLNGSAALWIYSPVRLTKELKEALSALGTVKYIVAPNFLHHLWLEDWIHTFDDVEVWSVRDLSNRFPDLRIDHYFESYGLKDDDALSCPLTSCCQIMSFCCNPLPCCSECCLTGPPMNCAKMTYSNFPSLEGFIFDGSSCFKEVVFFHKPTKTLILADMIQFLEEGKLNQPLKLFAQCDNILYPSGNGVPRDLQTSFLGNTKIARRNISIVQGWSPKRVLGCHGKLEYFDDENVLLGLREWYKWAGTAADKEPVNMCEAVRNVMKAYWDLVVEVINIFIRLFNVIVGIVFFKLPLRISACLEKKKK